MSDQCDGAGFPLVVVASVLVLARFASLKYNTTDMSIILYNTALLYLILQLCDLKGIK